MKVKFLDRIAIALVVVYGGYLFWTKMMKKPDTRLVTDFVIPFIIIATFLATIYLYCYGYLKKQFCFCEDFNSACLWHSLLHCCGAFGHICIVLL